MDESSDGTHPQFQNSGNHLDLSFIPLNISNDSTHSTMSVKLAKQYIWFIHTHGLFIHTPQKNLTVKNDFTSALNIAS